MNNPNDISQEEFERIERYLLKSMAADEKINFEKELGEDQGFSDKLSKVKAMVEGIEEVVLRESMEGFHQQLNENRKIKPKGGLHLLWLPISIAASLVLLIGLFTWLFWIRPSAEEQLFLAHYQPDPGLVTAMGSSMEYEFDRGMVDYKMGDYAAAIQRWENLIQEKAGNDTLNYFLGAAHLGLKNTDSAKAYFQKVLDDETNRFTEDAYWYMGLTNVLSNEFEKAMSYLEKSNHPDKENLMKRLQKK